LSDAVKQLGVGLPVLVAALYEVAPVHRRMRFINKFHLLGEMSCASEQLMAEIR
jgi:hypothetical protein